MSWSRRIELLNWSNACGGKLDFKTLSSSGSPNPQTPHLCHVGQDERPAFLISHYYLTATENIDRSFVKTVFHEPFTAQCPPIVPLKLDTYGKCWQSSGSPTLARLAAPATNRPVENWQHWRHRATSDAPHVAFVHHLSVLRRLPESPV